LITCLITALILWWIEQRFGFSFYSWTFWFVIPAGAILSGFAGTSGYLAGSMFFGHLRTRLLLLNIVIALVATFFLIHYLSYAAMLINGKKVRDLVSFWRYLDIAIRSMSMEFRIRGPKLVRPVNSEALGTSLLAFRFWICLWRACCLRLPHFTALLRQVFALSFWQGQADSIHREQGRLASQRQARFGGPAKWGHGDCHRPTKGLRLRCTSQYRSFQYRSLWSEAQNSGSPPSLSIVVPEFPSLAAIIGFPAIQWSQSHT